MTESVLSIPDLLNLAADALETAYRGRIDAPPASLSLILTLRDRAQSLQRPVITSEDPEAESPTVTQDEP